jgi:hypothetical protein
MEYKYIFFNKKRADQLSMHVQTYIQDQESLSKIVHHEKLKKKVESMAV